MKTTSYLCFLLSFTSFNMCYAQWEEVFVRNNFINNNLHFINDSTGFWSGWTSDTISGNIIRNELILRTQDYGISWDTVHYVPNILTNQNSIVGVRSTFFTTPLKGFMVGVEWPKLLSTQDGGLSWQLSSPFTTSGCASANNKILFTDSLNGYVINSGCMYKTNDGGITWLRDSTIWGGEDLSMPSENIGYGCYAKTIDGFDSQIFYNTGDLPFTRDQIEFWNDSSGIIAGYNSSGLPDSQYFLARTTDSGNSWSLTSYPESVAQFQELQMMNDSIGYAFYFMKTIDGGITWYWQEIPVSTIIHYQYLHCPSLNVCYTSGSSARMAHIARTLNGGGPLIEIVGIKNTEDPGNKLEISPNPCTHEIKLLSCEFPLEVTITSLQGQSVLKGLSHKNVLDVSGLNPGIYFITLHDAKGIRVNKFIKLDP